MEQEFFASEAARMLGISTQSLVVYERKGVISLRRIGGTRVYTVKDIAAIREHRKSHRPGRRKRLVEASPQA